LLNKDNLKNITKKTMLIHGLFLFFLHPPLKRWAIKGVQAIESII